jgi:hypothetical protein
MVCPLHHIQGPRRQGLYAFGLQDIVWTRRELRSRPPYSNSHSACRSSFPRATGRRKELSQGRLNRYFFRKYLNALATLLGHGTWSSHIMQVANNRILVMSNGRRTLLIQLLTQRRTINTTVGQIFISMPIWK